MRKSLPFVLTKDRSFFESLGDWMGDVLYDELPEKGFECRDEQIFMAYQIEQALKEKNVLFAEAGVGTGKTIAYLLPAVSYARYTGKPALIACADETLIDQLVKEGGDIYKLQKTLGLEIDVRLAKSRDQYLCLKRFEEAEKVETDEWIDDISFSIPDGVYAQGSMIAIQPYGERSNYPTVSDEDWQKVNYNSIMQCSVCDLRNRCGQTLHRAHYRKSADLIICSQDFLMEHLATKESREREGQLALLPEVSMMVLDEGHLLEYAAQKAMTYKVQATTIVQLLERLMVDGVRERTLYVMEKLQDDHELFFDQLRDDLVASEEERKRINKSPNLLKYGKQLIQDVETLLEEFVFESEMYMIPEYELNMAEEYLEQYEASLRIFIAQGDAVDWLEETDGEETLVIMPRLITEVLAEKLFSKKLPIIFSSATLSVKKDFSYIAYSLGIRDYQSFSVPSPFDYEEVMRIYLHELSQKEKTVRVQQLLRDGKKTLILFKSKQAMLDFKAELPIMERMYVAFEGDRELSGIVRDFQEGTIKTLCSYHLWEGLDLPEEALTRVIIFDLPFPPHDPLFDAKRTFAENPYEEVELPFMQLRLQQGMGRLIRTSNDRGDIHILMNEEEAKQRKTFEDILAVTPEIK
ncbi:ATP-dependent helicase [Lysinibacillus sphaericus]|uniref:ATP-dependent DNA helicase n=1 Tax=Lysinibacillus sphaericus TaxID=1421 RepID=UPI0018CC93BF|nr:ATP-dependent DNA helicase [Lysinibacillus sphaericus]MBG9453992.1 ATP-dependent helicase [Lysinibacillus sphaericus]MBG9478409.1 ATP-dependent helicase [Lysinibacillus sphaericus]MBG9592058.1 ATP-dependent helicase [Lysinibacillus sphaericus]